MILSDDGMIILNDLTDYYAALIIFINNHMLHLAQLWMCFTLLDFVARIFSWAKWQKVNISWGDGLVWNKQQTIT